MILDSSGNVGIGTDTPGSGYKLEVIGNIKADALQLKTYAGLRTGTGVGSIILGHLTRGTAGGEYSVSAGKNNTSTGQYSVAMGESNTSTGDSSVAMGTYNSTAITGKYSVAMGYNNRITGKSSVAMGKYNNFNATTSGDYSVAMGLSNITSGEASVAMGNNNNFGGSSGDYSVAMGTTNTSTGGYSVAMGIVNTSTGESSVAMGRENTSGDDSSVAMGRYNHAYAIHSVALGNRAWTGGNIRFAIGINDTQVDALAYSSNNNNKFVIDVSGNVGIGTDTPDYILDVFFPGGSGNGVRIKGGVSGTQLILDSDIGDGYNYWSAFRSSNHWDCYNSSAKYDEDAWGHTMYLQSYSGGNINLCKSGGSVYFRGSAYWTSDDRLKHNEIIIDNALETINKLTAKKYFKTLKMYAADKNFPLDASGNPIDDDGSKLKYRIETGFIAQEVQKIPELEYLVKLDDDDDKDIFEDKKDENGNIIYEKDGSGNNTKKPEQVYAGKKEQLFNLNYQDIFVLNVQATQELDRILQAEKIKLEATEVKLEEQTTKLEAAEVKLGAAEVKISTLESENTALKSRLDAIESRLTSAGIN
tara:strand:+ start:1 stop:1758 length:1758 start_codon:yes stop_codon:yes gene_type:complete